MGLFNNLSYGLKPLTELVLGKNMKKKKLGKYHYINVIETILL